VVAAENVTEGHLDSMNAVVVNEDTNDGNVIIGEINKGTDIQKSKTIIDDGDLSFGCSVYIMLIIS
jgi:hypothetical protein